MRISSGAWSAGCRGNDGAGSSAAGLVLGADLHAWNSSRERDWDSLGEDAWLRPRLGLVDWHLLGRDGRDIDHCGDWVGGGDALLLVGCDDLGLHDFGGVNLCLLRDNVRWDPCRSRLDDWHNSGDGVVLGCVGGDALRLDSAASPAASVV